MSVQADGSIPLLVTGHAAIFLILVVIQILLSNFRGKKEEPSMNRNHSTVVPSGLETLWAVGTGYLGGSLPI